MSPSKGWATAALACLSVCASGCGPAPKEPTTVKPKALTVVDMVTPARLVPQLGSAAPLRAFSDEQDAHALVAGLRLEITDSGHVRRARDRFPAGSVEHMRMPERLGGGFLFYQADSQGTRLWRASDWTAELKPLSYIAPTAAEVLAGFDRLYVRTRSNTLIALDHETGGLKPRGSLPAAPAFGAMVFADGWRAVVDTDLRGPLATFDAGATWLPLDLPHNVVNAWEHEGDPLLFTDGGRYRLDVNGYLQRINLALVDDPEEDEESASGGPVLEPHPLGSHPLRVAVERGWPQSNELALVAQRGELVRVSLPDAKVVARNRKTGLDKEADCQALLLGSGVGFVCAAPQRDTVVYELVPPLDLRERFRFAGPRFVASSGNGALVVRGSCSEASASAANARSYCIVHVDGSTREIAVTGQFGAERVIALRDNRVVVLVPPRLDRLGRLSIIAGEEVSSVELSYPEKEEHAVEVARTGLWLEGFEERGDELAGWVEAGGPAIGVRIGLDGKVKLGKLYDQGGQLLVSGRFALATNDAEGALESTDGGMTWRELELPQLPTVNGGAKTRGCSPLGCSLPGWVRIGWGRTAVKDDLVTAELPESISVRSKSEPTLHATCSLISQPGSPLPPRGNSAQTPFSAWAPFLNSPAPSLRKGDIGVDKLSQGYDETAVHAYVWGPKGSDWTRGGWWALRFEDKFALRGARSSSPTRPSWSDEISAAEGIGTRHRGSYRRWYANSDPAGTAALVSVCSGSYCLPHAVVDGRPILPLQFGTSGQTQGRPIGHGVARLGETWFYLTEEAGSHGLLLWRADVGSIQQLGRIRRLNPRRFAAAGVPMLVRRALSNELGLLVQIPADPSTAERVGRWQVLPVDVHNGQLGEPIALGPASLGEQLPRKCGDHDDGWLVELPASYVAIRTVGANGYLDDVELRMRIDPNQRCVEAIAARASRRFPVDEDHLKRKEPLPNLSVPMVARERNGPRRWSFMCGPRDKGLSRLLDM